MNTEKCNNSDCKKEFHVRMIGGGVPGGKEREEVVCPYCNNVVRSEMTSAVFRTSKIENK